MFPQYSPVSQALLGTLFTWFLTAIGASAVVLMPILGSLVGPGVAQEKVQRKILDSALGFASGVMLAASFWSLLEPAVEMAVSDRAIFTLANALSAESKRNVRRVI
jgi:zinc transporter ZupT